MNRRVLIVDDDKFIREILTFNVRRMGYDVVEAGNGVEAIEVLGKSTVDLVLADVWMPEMSGLDLLKTITKEYSGLPVALISGQATLDSTIDALNMGAYAYLLKPVQAEQIRDVVNRGIRKVEDNEARTQMSRRLEQLTELEQTLKSLQESRPQNGSGNAASGAISSLIEGLRHELGNVSMAITLNISTLEQQGKLPPEVKENLEDLHASADDLVSLVNRLKDYDTPGKVAESHDLRTIAADVLDMMDEVALIKRIKLERKFAADEVSVTGEPDSLHRALRQVVENAMEAVKPGGRVQVIVDHSDLKTALVRINDDGPGFDKESLPKVFQPEYTTKLKEGFVKGLGMGLFIARAIIELHGGKISACNLPEGGASVEIQLPSHSFVMSH
ncbi:MAG: response regulator [Anaerolineae bacterium]|nr:response regulator [Anaerolineae bacterium]